MNTDNKKAFHLTKEDEDQLKELLNIGVSHASTTLSRLLGRMVRISVPNIGVKKDRTLMTVTSDPNAVTIAVLLRLSGILEGYVFLNFPFAAAAHLLHSLSGKKVTDLRALDRYDKSVFQEIGNVLTGGMLSGLSQFLHVEIVQSVPDVAIDMGGAMFNSIAASMVDLHNEYLELDVTICVETAHGSYACESGEEAVAGMYLFLGPDAADKILELTKGMVSAHEQ